MRRELQRTKQELASTKQEFASTKQKLQGEIDLLRGKNLESMDKEALVKRKTDLEDIQREAQRRVDDAGGSIHLSHHHEPDEKSRDGI